MGGGERHTTRGRLTPLEKISDVVCRVEYGSLPGDRVPAEKDGVEADLTSSLDVMRSLCG